MPLPYSVLMKIPPFDTGRTPVRFVVMGLFFLMIVAACGLSWMETFLAARLGARGRRWSWLAMLLVFAWTTAEVYSATPRRPPFVPPADLSRIAPGPVLNLPPVQWDGYAAMLQTFHHQPIATGYLARNSEAQWAQFGLLKTAFDKGGAPFCEYLKSNGFRTVVISPDSVTMPYRFSMSPLDLSRCPVNVVDLRERGPGPFGVPQPDGSERPVDYPPYVRGTRIHFGTAEIDKYLWYGWSGREITFALDGSRQGYACFLAGAQRGAEANSNPANLRRAVSGAGQTRRATSCSKAERPGDCELDIDER